MAKKENVYPFIAAMVGLFLSSVIVLEIAGGIESLFNEFSLIFFIVVFLTVILIGVCFFLETKTQILQWQTRKLLQTQSDLLQKNSDLLQTLLDKQAEISRQQRSKVPVFKIGVN
jgi:hypothetical protein